MDENKRLFMQWMEENFPETYGAALIEATDRTNAVNAFGLGAHAVTKPIAAPPQKSWWNNFTTAIGDVGGKFLQYKSQQKVLRLQLQRAKQGLPPLDMSRLAPVIKVQPELSPEMVDDVKKYMVPAAIGLGAVLLIVLMGRRKR